MKCYLLCMVVFFQLSLGCNSYKKQIKSNGDYEDAIHNAVIDFSNTSLFKKGLVFKVYHETIDDELYYIRIIEDFENKYLYSKSKEIEDNKLPSRFYEIENKLFIWWDDNYSINEKTFRLLEKYGMLKDDEGGWVMFLNQIIDEKKKGAIYYFCKNDLRIYKRIITNLGVIPKPEVKCK